MDTLARDIGTIAEHVKKHEEQLKTLQTYLKDLTKFLNQRPTAEIVTQNPLMNQSYIDIVRITASSLALNKWTGVRQRINTAGELVDCEVATAPIQGFKGTATSLPAVGQKVPIMFLGKEAGYATISDHVIISPSSSVTVVLSGALPSATWSAATKKLTPATHTAPVLQEQTDGKLLYSGGVTTSFQIRFLKSVTITNGKCRIGEVVNGRLIAVDCEEFVLN